MTADIKLPFLTRKEQNLLKQVKARLVVRELTENGLQILLHASFQIIFCR